MVEYPSSSMQAPKQHVMKEADTEITMSVPLGVSLVFFWAHVVHLVKSRRIQRMICLLCWE